MSELDEPTLRQIAENTGGRYFSAGNSDTVADAFSAIDEAQKIEFQAKSYLLADELFIWFASPGLALLLLSALLAASKRTSVARADSVASLIQ